METPDVPREVSVMSGNNSDRIDRGRRTAVEILEGRAMLSSSAVVSTDAAGIQTLPPPVVETVYVNGTRWSQSFKDYLAAQVLGSPTHGWDVTDNRAQSPVWINIDQVTVIFQDDMMVDAADLSVRGVNVREYAVASFRAEFDNDIQRTIATWTLARPLVNDSVVIEINGDPPDGVRSRSSLIFLDGDYDQQPGGIFRQHFYCLPGDAAPDGRVNAIDLAGVKRGLGGDARDMI